jgi:hypothetical protein
LIRKGILLLATAALLGGGANTFLNSDPAETDPPDPACNSCDARHQNLGRLREQLSQETMGEK